MNINSFIAVTSFVEGLSLWCVGISSNVRVASPVFPGLWGTGVI